MRGTVKWFNNPKGYGFIINEEGTDIFVHYTGISNEKNWKTLEEGQNVTFDIINSEKGVQAVNVEVV